MNSTIQISPKAQIGKNVNIGRFTIIHDHVIIGDNSNIGSHCELGIRPSSGSENPLIIGENSNIRSHSVFYLGSQFGPELVTGHRVTVRECIRAGVGLQIGTLSDFQGFTEIGDYVKTHSNVHIGQGTKLENYIWIFPYTVLTNDPHPPSEVRQSVVVKNFAVISTHCCILPGVTIGHDSLVGANSLVIKNVDPETVVGGVPAKEICNINKIKLKDGTGRPAYPWRNHFHRGYPQTAIQEWLKSAG